MLTINSCYYYEMLIANLSVLLTAPNITVIGAISHLRYDIIYAYSLKYR